MLDFHDHRRELAQNRYVYAVVSRRANGLSVGVNINSDKVCNFNCLYCQVERTVPVTPVAVDVPQLRAELDAILARVGDGSIWDEPPFDAVPASLRQVADIAFAGDGEPTTPPSFPTVAAAARASRAAAGLRLPLRLLTNGTMLHRARVAAALGYFDEIWCKLDAGTSEHFRVIDGTSFPFGRLLANLLETARRRPIVVQSMFMALDGVEPPVGEIDAWAGRLAHISSGGGHIDRVQVYTVARVPASSRVAPLGDATLEAIAARVRQLGIPVAVFGTGSSSVVEDSGEGSIPPVSD